MSAAEEEALDEVLANEEALETASKKEVAKGKQKAGKHKRSWLFQPCTDQEMEMLAAAEEEQEGKQPSSKKMKKNRIVAEDDRVEADPGEERCNATQFI